MELLLQIQECLDWRGEILSFQKIAAENKVRKSKAKFYLVFLEFSADPIFLMLPNTGKLGKPSLENVADTSSTFPFILCLF